MENKRNQFSLRSPSRVQVPYRHGTELIPACAKRAAYPGPGPSRFYVIDTGSMRPRARPAGPGIRLTELGVTYLPSTLAQTMAMRPHSQLSGHLDLPLALLGAPVSIGALVKLGSRSLAKQDRDWSSRPPGTGLHVPIWRNRGSAAIHPSRSRG